MGARHPDRDLHDWTQEGRELTHRFPEPAWEERADASRPGAAPVRMLWWTRSPSGAADRLAAGGEKYRQILDVGQATIAHALYTARRALPEDPERTAVRHAPDDLTARHLPQADAERIANVQLDSEIEAGPQRDRLVPPGRRRVPRARPRPGRGRHRRVPPSSGRLNSAESGQKRHEHT
ncbi:hypothetical protein ETD86_54025 [Nonomuraea turkmeniaca]|uniref:Uncharacterized protein n=1 Tax=Nonomuraea turkmeniaca TaxID=103838 RepID=A0A5S4FDY2_9ACTN|nr:hypothetical protein [Nonomuraea turkmeniaca]TMR03054.1 hypothetical protein ETD86_54025 [Nonomuraea turkmeniaca]